MSLFESVWNVIEYLLHLVHPDRQEVVNNDSKALRYLNISIPQDGFACSLSFAIDASLRPEFCNYSISADSVTAR